MGTSNADFSVFVSDVVDVLGYSQEMVSHRRQHMLGENDEVMVVAGSTGEGITSMFESDIDLMMLDGDTVCTDDVSKYVDNPDITTFVMNTEDASPGYTLLKPSSVPAFTEFEDPLEKYGDNYYVQSADILKYMWTFLVNDIDFCDDDVRAMSLAGPSFASTMYGIPCDIVKALKCDCAPILQAFLSRPRKHDQPSAETLNRISELDGHVVPVGNSSGAYAHLEWRICYTLAEKYLVCQFNETQIKLYVLLKMLVKSTLANYKNISSYILKNLVLWMAEKIPCEQFKKELLVQRLLDALTLLKLCVKNSYLPNYMIPQRNLFSRKFKRYEQVKVLKVLSGMVDEGASVLLRCPKLKRAMLVMHRSPYDRAVVPF